LEYEALPQKEYGMQSEADLDLIRQHDPDALRLVAEENGGYYLAKRVLDIFAASILLSLLLPLMVLIALAIKIYSPGPIFFVQERVGSKRRTRGKKSYWKRATFSCYKFRTMHLNADSSIHQAYIKALINNDHEQIQILQGNTSNIHKLVHDSRITRPGKLLRKLSLDELPQLFNVMRGDMSLVGPRPAIPYEVAMYKPWHLQRLEVQPGITGLQQVTSRSTANFDEQVRLDIEYIHRQSAWLDIMIILKTPFVIISTRGAG
jgi:lipopolysaccharide/colanic/teichoic acid biosynthesis glycosyltransferase